MNTVIDCIPCFVRQAAEAVGFCATDEAGRATIMRRILSDIAETSWNASPPVVAQTIHRGIRKETRTPDPYADLKTRMNRMALEMFQSLRQEAHLDEDPRMAIVRLAIAGNMIDAGAKTGLRETDIRSAICRACRERVHGPIDELFATAQAARHILYLADNAGEIVFDRALVEALPMEKVYVAVRGSPVLNDATALDAEVAGLQGIVRVVSSGSDAPGIIIEDCSEEFRRVFDSSDLIIAKGQGNYESLCDISKQIYFLLLVKCPRVAADIGAPIGSLVVSRGRNGGTTMKEGK